MDIHSPIARRFADADHKLSDMIFSGIVQEEVLILIKDCYNVKLSGFIIWT